MARSASWQRTRARNLACPPQGEPAWLVSTFPPAILHSGDPGDTGAGYQLIVYAPPDVDRSLLDQAGKWVEIVGHFNDPASADCLYRPNLTFPNALDSPGEAETNCRQRLAVESIVEVAGP